MTITILDFNCSLSGLTELVSVLNRFLHFATKGRQRDRIFAVQLARNWMSIAVCDKPRKRWSWTSGTIIVARPIITAERKRSFSSWHDLILRSRKPLFPSRAPRHASEFWLVVMVPIYLRRFNDACPWCVEACACALLHGDMWVGIIRLASLSLVPWWRCLCCAMISRDFVMTRAVKAWRGLPRGIT